MSIECKYCERDARSGHAPDCPRLQRKAGMENELAALAGQMRDLAADMNSTLSKAAAKPQQRTVVKDANLAAACADTLRDLVADMNSTLNKTAAKPQQRPVIKGATLAAACADMSAKLADGKPVMLPGIGRLIVIERTVRGVRRSSVRFEATTALKNAIAGQKRGVKQ